MDITIVLTTSPHRYGKHDDMISLSIASLQEFGFADCPIIICADGVNKRSRFFEQDRLIDYSEYLDSIETKFKNAKVLRNKNHLGLTRNSLAGLKLVDTKYVFSFQHDLSLCPEFRKVDLKSILDGFDDSGCGFYIFTRAYDPLGDTLKRWFRAVPFPDKMNIPKSWNVSAGFGFLDSHGITTKKNYIDVINKEYRPEKTMFIEDSIHAEMKRFTSGNFNEWAKYKVAVRNGHHMIFHLDGHSKAANGLGFEKIWSQGCCHPGIIKDYSEWMSDKRCGSFFKKCFLKFLSKENSLFEHMKNNIYGNGNPQYIKNE